MTTAMGLILIGGIALSLIWGARRTSIARSRLLNAALENGWPISFSDSGLIQATFSNCVVSIEYTSSTDDGTSTRFSAQSAAPPWFSFSVRRRRPSAFAEPSEGRVQLGAPFDDAFTLESNDPEFARAWFNQTLRRSFGPIARNDLGLSLRLSRGNLVAELDGEESRARVLAAVAQLVADTATADHDLKSRWALLSRDLTGQSEPSCSLPPTPILVSQPSCFIRIELVRAGETWVTRLTWTPVASANFKDDSFQRELPGLVLDSDTIRDAIEEGLRAVAGGKRGPYR